MMAARLTTEVREEGLFIRYRPFHRREKQIPLENMVKVEAVTYRPILEYGGWGIRSGWSGKAYNARGNRGARIEYAAGQRLLIGSQRAEELAGAIRAVMMA